MIIELSNVFRRMAEDASLRAVLLMADGDSFCAGIDPDWTREMLVSDETQSRMDYRLIQGLLEALIALPQPVAAIVQGPVIGPGVGMIACADIVIASEDSTFSVSDVRMGLTPAPLLPYLAAAMGARAAARWVLMAERYDAKIALQSGLVHQVISTRKKEQAIASLEARFGEAGPEALRVTKKILVQAKRNQIDAISSDSNEIIAAQLRVSFEGQEGIKAFLEQRRPAWAVD